MHTSKSYSDFHIIQHDEPNIAIKSNNPDYLRFIFPTNYGLVSNIRKNILDRCWRNQMIKY